MPVDDAPALCEDCAFRLLMSCRTSSHMLLTASESPARLPRSGEPASPGTPDAVGASHAAVEAAAAVNAAAAAAASAREGCDEGEGFERQRGSAGVEVEVPRGVGDGR